MSFCGVSRGRTLNSQTPASSCEGYPVSLSLGVNIVNVPGASLSGPLLVSAPLRGGASARAEERDEVLRADLEAARESKYREIRDAELDYRTGKLSEGDWQRLDRELRAEAIDILRRLDDLGPAPDERVGADRPPE